MAKEEQPSTHEDGESQKLVDRIEKKVDAQGKKRTPKTPSKAPQQKRNLRVVEWAGTVPSLGVCTFCNLQFKVPMESMKRLEDAQWNLDLQFREHKCKPEDASQGTTRIVREATKD